MKGEKRVCKNICNKFKVKKPTVGSRYGSGQGRCQICDVWINHKGAHMKDGSPAIENSVGWHCNCCNYRIRQKPRNRIIKEKLKKETSQTYEIKKLQNKIIELKEKKIFLSYDEVEQLKEENNDKNRKSKKESRESITDLEKNNFNLENEINILQEVKNIITNHKKEKYQDIDIKTDLIDVYLELNSIKKVSEITNQSESIIREYIKSPKRLPSKLKQAYDDNELSVDPKLGLNIAIHAVDYHNWDGESDNQEKIYEFAIELSQYFKNHPSYKDEFFNINIRKKEQFINQTPETIHLNRLKAKYPYFSSSFRKDQDRDEIQYEKLISTNDLRIAKFVLMWENKHMKRISKEWACEMLTNPDEFLTTHKI